ncbi:LCP family protein [Butyrivibrio sp. WCD3002]|uniref:LCP family protein n=1 Tax=Butyrivibrio sp. WCD3002 TaxID=1280676 RepID=UPI0003F6374A|nr:LCP family protein [Butyrivibrio sp. WCD3002]
MKRFEKAKVVLTLIGAALAVAILFFGISLVEKRMEQKAYAERAEADDDSDDEYDEYELAEDELLIGDTVYRYNTDVKNYLIIGTDASGNSEDDGKYRGQMADYLVLLVLNRLDNNYAFLQIDRDTVTDVPMMNEDGSAYASSEMQICTAHWYGGNSEQSNENTVNTVSSLLGGVPIEGYYEVNMDQIPRLNHIVDGVTVTIEDDLTEADPSLIKGETITLSDDQAYAFLRARMSVADGSNENRMNRQKQYMDAYLHKIIEKTKENANFPNTAYKDMKEYANTDLTGNDISKILNRISQGENLGVQRFEGAHKLGKLLDDNIEHQEFYIDYNSFLEIMTKLYDIEKVKTLSLEEENEE